MAAVLFFNLSGDKGRKVRMLCMKLGFKIRNVDPSEYMESIGALAGVRDMALTGEKYDGPFFEDEMLVMKDFSNGDLDRFLKGFRSMKIPPVALKAVITETNSSWNCIKLHDEIKAEHEQMHYKG